MRRAMLNALAVGLIAGSTGMAQADGVKVGTLNCDEAAGWGLVFSSSRDLKCVFSPADKAAKSEHYSGTIKKYGVDLGFVDGAVLLWAVVSSDGKTQPGALAGSYGGVGAAAGVETSGRLALRTVGGSDL